MDHREYIESYLSADADGELSAAERQAVAAHLAECADCRQMLPEERALKAAVKADMPLLRAPDSLRLRIVAGLDQIDRAAARSRRLSVGARWVAVAALAASLVLVTLKFRVQPPNPSFDAAIASFERSQKAFTPTIGASSVDDAALALINQFGVALVWDFSSVGLAPAGGRIDHRPDGTAVAYMMYKGGKDSLLCIMDRRDVMPALSGGNVVKGIHIYSYKGFTIAATNRYAVYCIMVTKLRPADLARAFERLPA